MTASYSYSYLACIEALQAAATSLRRTPSRYSYQRWRLRQANPAAIPYDGRILLMLGPWEQALRLAGLREVRR